MEFVGPPPSHRLRAVAAGCGVGQISTRPPYPPQSAPILGPERPTRQMPPRSKTHSGESKAVYRTKTRLHRDLFESPSKNSNLCPAAPVPRPGVAGPSCFPPGAEEHNPCAPGVISGARSSRRLQHAQGAKRPVIGKRRTASLLGPGKPTEPHGHGTSSCLML